MRNLWKEKSFEHKGQMVNYFNKLRNSETVGFCTCGWLCGKGWTCCWEVVRK